MRKTGFIIFLVSHLYSYSQETTINGYVKDADNGDAIPYAICYDSISSKGTTTNLEGFFNFKISPHQKLALKISHIGYFSNNIEIVSSKDTTVTIQLHPRLEELAEVKITEFASFQKQEVLGKITVPKSTIQAIPSFIGIPDLMKAITFIPGVSGGREGYSNIYVRGGDRGQNLILLDGIKLYNTNHIGGFLSLINSEIITQVDVYKGGFPARYGGRASSVIDTYTMDGSNDKVHGKFNLGILSSGLMLEGPINKNWNFVVAGRTSYFNLVSSLIDSGDDPWNQTYKYNIYDVNSKLTWQPSVNHKISLSFFTGSDDQESGESYANWENSANTINKTDDKMSINTTGISLLYRGKLSEKLYTENLVSYSKYDNKLSHTTIQTIDSNSITDKVNSFSNIEDYTLESTPKSG